MRCWLLVISYITWRVIKIASRFLPSLGWLPPSEWRKRLAKERGEEETRQVETKTVSCLDSLNNKISKTS